MKLFLTCLTTSFLTLTLFCSSMVFDYPEIPWHSDGGVESMLVNVLDASSLSVKMDYSEYRKICSMFGITDETGGAVGEIDGNPVIVVKIAFIDYIINPMAKMCIREAAVSFLRLAVEDAASIFFTPLSFKQVDGIDTFDSIIWTEEGGKRIYVNSLLVYNKYAVVSEVPEAYEFLFDFGSNSVDSKLKGRANF